MKLGELIGSDNNSVIELSEDTKDLQVLGLSYDSRTTTTGDMFFCLKGESHDGHDFAASAVKKGARILVCLLYTSPSPRDRTRSRMPSSA